MEASLETTSIRDALARPSAFPEPRPSHVDVEETHASWVFLGGEHALKVKKPVDFGFLDFRTIERRKEACEAEVTLNRRLAPSTYRGVIPVRRRGDGTLGFGGEGTIVDWAVHMARLSDDVRADRLLEAGQLSGAIVDRIAERLAAFHAAAKSDAATSAYGSIDAIAKNVVENFDQTRSVVTSYVRSDEAYEIEKWQLGFLRDHAARFEKRIADRRIRDGHGDLRLEHVYSGKDESLTIVDCIEFNERFRFADVCADVAFFSMDLAWHERVDLAERFLACYARCAGDFDLYGVVDFYESYRAYVRGKVATMLAADGGASAELRERAAHEARRFFLLALSAQRRSLLWPALVCVGGVIASGKSTIADAIAREMSAPVIDADRTRKQMLGVTPTQHVNEAAWKGAYDPDFTSTVYAEVFRRAWVVLASGRPVVIDASFRSAVQRRAACDLARSLRVPIRFIECRADADVCRARLLRRENESGVSDGRLAIFDDFVARFEPMTELSMLEHLIVDSSRGLDETLATIRKHVQTWPRGLVA